MCICHPQLLLGHGEVKTQAPREVLVSVAAHGTDMKGIQIGKDDLYAFGANLIINVEKPDIIYKKIN